MSKLEKIRGSVGKGRKNVSFVVPLNGVNFLKPNSISERGYAGFVNQYVSFEIEVDGVTLPVDGKLGLYVSPKNWKEFQAQIAGKREGAAMEAKDDEVAALRAELAEMKELMKKMAGM